MVVWDILTMSGKKNAILADSQRKGVIIGCPLACTCGDVNYASKTRTCRSSLVMQGTYNR